jgi:4-diphosphocytidyl-2-C-methyl-D-erythritol kinase
VRRLLAPAKLTVSLRVRGVRPDGYHELDAEMVTLSLADELVFREADEAEATHETDEADATDASLVVDAEPGTRADELPAAEDNLVVRALAACGRRASVRLIKRIPLGGGLGGGSADAAAVLRWAGCADATVAARLGADVPFCVVGGRARVEGVGERVSPLRFEPRDYLLLLPPFGVDTSAVYRAWDEHPSHVAPNELAHAALAVEPRLALWRDALGELAGAEPVLAGSGSTWFVEGGPAEAGTASVAELRLGGEAGRLLRARTVPGDWTGD